MGEASPPILSAVDRWFLIVYYKARIEAPYPSSMLEGGRRIT